MIYILRNLWHVWRRFKTAGILNILGLATAFAAFVMVLIHVNFEYDYDQFHPDKERLYRLEYQQPDGWKPNFPRPLAEQFASSSAHIEAAGLWFPSYDLLTYLTVDNSVEGSGFREYIDYINPDFTEVITFDMLSGSSDVLQNPEMVLIPRSLARKFFGNEPAVGHRITFSGNSSIDGKYGNFMGGSYPQVVTVGGVYRDFPDNSVFPNHIYGRLDPKEGMTDEHTGAYYCFLKLDSPASRDLVIEEYLRNNDYGIPDYASDLRLTPVTEVYFNPVRSDTLPSGSRLMTQLLLAVGFLVVVIASINYVNFTVALTPFRIRAINTQKVFGCPVGFIRRQLVFESIIIAFTTFLLSLVFVELLNESRLLSDMFASLSLVGNWKPVLLSAVLSLFVGLLAGFYPAWYMTSFPTVMVLNGSFALSFKARIIRKSLIGIQYVISLTLIVMAIFVHIQNRYVGNMDLGFNKKHILEVELSSEISTTDGFRYRQMLLEHPDIEDVAFTQQKFVMDGAKPYNGTNYHGEHYYHYQVQVSSNFPALIGVQVVAGRDFKQSDEERTDGISAYLFNASAQRMMALVPGDSIAGCYIAGIFPDIHFESLHKAIEPMAFIVSPKGHWNLPFPLNYSYVKLLGDDIQPAIDHIRKVLHEIDPAFPVKAELLDGTLDALYAKDHNLGVMITLLCLLTVLISSVGVFGLVIFETQARTKEIALRKVMGATVREVLVMFNTGFLRIVLVCFVIALPLSWWSVSTWLDNFSYRTPIYLWVFLVALLLLLILTIVTVTFQSYRTATANPARSLQK